VRRLVLPAVLGVLSLGSAGLAVAPALDDPAPAAAVSGVTTPVFSLRRLPGTLTRMVAAERLRADLDEVLAQPVLGEARDSTCLAVRDPEGKSVYERQIAMPLIPASTTKLVTGAVVLEKLGADTRYTTAVKAAGPAQDGAVGDMWLVGSGDPLLATADYAATAGWMGAPRPVTSIEGLADRIVNAGVRRIGRLLGDESRYDTQRYLPTWEPTYASTPEVGPQSALTVNDGYAQWQGAKVPSTAPATHGATVLANLLRARGVTVGAVSEGKAPDAGAVVTSVESPPVSEIVGTILRDSGNLTSELLVKELGVRFGGGGTTQAGLTVLRSTAASLGLPMDQLAPVDGSGLDRGGRLTCNVLQGLLARAGDDSPLFRGMPVAGQSGTLIRRFNGTPAAGKVRAKTGSLSEVVGLSGWTTALDGRSVQFSLVANELPSESVGMALQDKVVSALAAYPEAPSADDIAPAPPQSRPG
jgi:D-alanyl-D-alanine carboxypeptidase/D-alanyl-D-alanine-endopeptidase (penicillin-binding protein 4)